MESARGRMLPVLIFATLSAPPIETVPVAVRFAKDKSPEKRAEPWTESL